MLASLRILKMARLLLAQEALLPPGFHRQAPWRVRAFRRLLIIGAPRFAESERGRALSDRIRKLGPIYIKFGQFLATRADIIGPAMAADLQHLQDRLPPFAERKLAGILAEDFDDLDTHIGDIGAPIAAASIAQVHTATAKPSGQKLAMKVLRPDIDRRINAEMRAFTRFAGWLEKLVPASRRLRPVAALETLRVSLMAETDLRLEAAALSEMATNAAADRRFEVPKVYWEASSKHVLSMHWVDGVPASDLTALRAAGHDLPDMAVRLIRIFLTQALRDGFFHADMHQGNILVKPDGTLVAIDLGITGRLDADSRRFLAQILHGFITRDYVKVARVHIEAGYVPAHHNVDDFAQALRSIGEPIRDQNADNISMARLLSQLFDVTEQFDMETQTQLLLLQKTMVTVEGVARSFDPQLNIWDAAEPIVTGWLARELGPQALLREAADNAGDAARALIRLPETLADLQRGAKALQHMAAHQADAPRAAPPRTPLVSWLALAVATAAAILALL